MSAPPEQRHKLQDKKYKRVPAMPQITVTMGNLWLEDEDDPDEVSKAEVLMLQWYMTSIILCTLRAAKHNKLTYKRHSQS